MKKIFIIIFSLFLLTTQSFSYTPTKTDIELLDKVNKKIENTYNTHPERVEKLIPKIKEIQIVYKDRERISYIFWEIYNFINLLIFLNINKDVNDNVIDQDIIKDNNNDYENFKSDEIDDIFVRSKIDKKICSFDLWDLTKSLQKKTFIVSTDSELKKAIDYSLRADNRVEIVIKKGTYYLREWFWLSGNKLIIRWETWDNDDVKLFWEWMKWNVANIFWVANKDIMIWDLTIWEVKNHPIQLLWERDADNFILHNVVLVDWGEQLFKGSYNENKEETYADNWIIQCSEFNYSDWVWPQYYIWWIDIHKWYNFLVQYNKFSYIKSPEARIAEHAIHFWSDSHDVIVKNNIINDCDRWIWFWLWDSAFSSWSILDNEIYHDDSFWDVWIWLENASDILVKWNTIIFENDYENSIEYRFEWTKNVKITWNKVNKDIKSRDNWEAEVYDNEILK